MRHQQQEAQDDFLGELLTQPSSVRFGYAYQDTLMAIVYTSQDQKAAGVTPKISRARLAPPVQSDILSRITSSSAAEQP